MDQQIILSSAIVFIVFIISALLIYYILNLKNIKNRKEHFKHLHTHLQKGQKIEFCGGLYGTVEKIEEDIVKVKISPNSTIEVNRYSISRIIE